MLYHCFVEHGFARETVALHVPQLLAGRDYNRDDYSDELTWAQVSVMNTVQAVNSQ